MLRLYYELNCALAPNIVPVSYVDSIANRDFLESLALLPGSLDIFLFLQGLLDDHVLIAVHRLRDQVVD